MLRPGVICFVGLLAAEVGSQPSRLEAQDLPRYPIAATSADSGRDSLRGFSLGITLDQYLIESYRVGAISFRGLSLSPSHWGSEFGLGLLPLEGLSNMSVIADLGTAYQSPASGSLILLKLGTTGIFGGNAGLVGFYGGAGIVGRLGKGLVIRMDLTRRWFIAPGELPQVWLLSVGLASLSPPKR